MLRFLIEGGFTVDAKRETRGDGFDTMHHNTINNLK